MVKHTVIGQTANGNRQAPDFSPQALLHVHESCQVLREQVKSYLLAAEEHKTEQLDELKVSVKHIHNTLLLLNRQGVAMVTAEILELLQALVEMRVKDVEASGHTLVLAADRLTDYIAHLRQPGAIDSALPLLPILNNCRACRGESLLSDVLVLASGVSLPDASHLPAPNHDELKLFIQCIKETRQPLMLGLIGWFRDDSKLDQSIAELSGIFSRLAHACDAPTTLQPLVPLFECAEFVCLSVKQEALESDAALKRLFAQLERMLEKVSHMTEVDTSIFKSPASERLFLNLLYYVALSTATTPKAVALRRRFRLERFISQSLSSERSQLVFDGVGERLADSIRDRIAAETGVVRDWLSQAAQNLSHPEAEKIRSRLLQLEPAVMLLGANESLQHLRYINASFAVLIQGGSEDPNTQRPLLAEAIIRLEQSLDKELLVKRVGSSGAVALNEHEHIQQTCLAEAQRRLLLIEEQLGALFPDADSIEQTDSVLGFARPRIGDTVQQLRMIDSALQILPLPEVTPLIHGVQQFIETHEGQQLDTKKRIGLATVMVSLGYYLQSVLRPHGPAGRLLLEAEDALLSLRTQQDELWSEQSDFNALLGMAPTAQKSEQESGNLSSESQEQQKEPDKAAPVLVEEPSLHDILASDRQDVVAVSTDDQPTQDATTDEQRLQSMYEQFDIDEEDWDATLAERSNGSAVGSLIDFSLEKLSAITTGVDVVRQYSQASDERQQAFQQLSTHYTALSNECDSCNAFDLQKLADANVGLVHHLTKLPDSRDGQLLLDESVAVLPQLINQLQSSTDRVRGLEQLLEQLTGFVSNTADHISSTVTSHQVVGETAEAHSSDHLDGDETFLEQTLDIRNLVQADASINSTAEHTEFSPTRALEQFSDITDVDQLSDISGMEDASQFEGIESLEGIDELETVEWLGDVSPLDEVPEYADAYVSESFPTPMSIVPVVSPDVQEVTSKDDHARTLPRPTFGEGGTALDNERFADSAYDETTDFGVMTLDSTLEQLFCRECEEHIDALSEGVEAALTFQSPAQQLPISDLLMGKQPVEHSVTSDIDESVALPNSHMLHALHTLTGCAQTVNAERIIAIAQPLQKAALLKQRHSLLFNRKETEYIQELVGALRAHVAAIESEETVGEEVLAVEHRLAEFVKQAEPLVPERKSGLTLNSDVNSLSTIFEEEARDLLSEMRKDAKLVRAPATQKKAIGRILSRLHTMKGSARMASQPALADRAHLLEDELQQANNGIAQNPNQPMSMLSSVLDTGLADLQTLMLVEHAELEHVQLPAVAKDTLMSASDASTDRMVSMASKATVSQARLGESLWLLRDAYRDLESTSERLLRLPREQMGLDSPAVAEMLADLDRSRRAMADALLEAESEQSIGSRANTALHQALIRAQLVAMGDCAERLQHAVTDAAAESEKEVKFDLLGGELTLDRSLYKRLLAPLEHLVRNAVVHGVESTQDRLANGKKPHGYVQLNVDVDGTDLLISVSDDGAGVDKTAVNRLRKDQGKEAVHSTDELRDTLCTAGFSTVEQANQVGGRGLGLVAVNELLDELGGTLQMATQDGKGTSFTLRIPQKVIVNHVVMVECEATLYAIPVSFVHSVIDDDAAQSRLLKEHAPQEVLAFNGQFYTQSPLTALLGSSESGNAQHARSLRANKQAVLVGAHGQHYALLVDAVLGYREIITQPLGAQLAQMRAYLGGGVLANGKQVLIPDLNRLLGDGNSTPHGLPTEGQLADIVPTVESSEQGMHSLAQLADDQMKVEAKQAESAAMALIVDDSITMRVAAEQMLGSLGVESRMARDGAEALELLKNDLPDVLLVDIDMPRLNGFDFLRHLRLQHPNHNTPIIMISTRTAQADRAEAKALGAGAYLRKPYSNAELEGALSDVGVLNAS